jgi:hypothetical protein
LLYGLGLQWLEKYLSSFFIYLYETNRLQIYMQLFGFPNIFFVVTIFEDKRGPKNIIFPILKTIFPL